MQGLAAPARERHRLDGHEEPCPRDYCVVFHVVRQGPVQQRRLPFWHLHSDHPTMASYRIGTLFAPAGRRARRRRMQGRKRAAARRWCSPDDAGSATHGSRETPQNTVRQRTLTVKKAPRLCAISHRRPRISADAPNLESSCTMASFPPRVVRVQPWRATACGGDPAGGAAGPDAVHVAGAAGVG